MDTHAHLNAEQFDLDRGSVIARAADAGLFAIIDIGTDLRCSESALENAQTPGIYASVGLHPHSASELASSRDRLEALANQPRVVAIGEIGLDYHYNYSDRHAQRECFAHFIGVAKQNRLPIIVHDRKAHQDVLDIILAEGVPEKTGVFHCFSGDWALARKVLDLGFYISIAGPVTFKNGQSTRDVAARVPLDRLLVETDSPYLTPVPYRGKRNEPAHVWLVAERIAELRALGRNEFAAAVSDNACRLFGLDKGWRLCAPNSMD